jgi:predicted dehydrogenase
MGSMQGFACAPLGRIRIGVVGVGRRGEWAVKRLSRIDGLEIVALADVEDYRLKEGTAALAGEKKPAAATYLGAESYLALADDPRVDLVYITAPWPVHVPAALAALERGKHCAVEVPCAMTLEECWRLVEAAERARRHVIPLENCCYGEEELFALNLCRNGILGDLVHAEGAYIHNLAAENFAEVDGCTYFTALRGSWDRWRVKWNACHDGNPYPTHGLGPICQYFNVNRSDRLDYVVSVSSRQAGITAFAESQFGADSPEARATYRLGDMNTSVFRTARGRTILIQHAVQSPRPYSRLNLVSGTKGTLAGYPLRVALSPKYEKWLEGEALAELKAAYTHPLVRTTGEWAKKVGGHGGMDFMMDLRWSFCLKNGLPMDADVYDAATWSCLTELSERSVANGSVPVPVPDFTRGGWQTALPLGIVDLR